MLTMRLRKSISLVLFIVLLLVSGVVWSMNTGEVEKKDGTFTGQAKGFADTVVVDVTISGGKLIDIQVRPHQETPFIADPAIEALIQNILEVQSADVNVVSGATVTSQAVISAVEQALENSAK